MAHHAHATHHHRNAAKALSEVPELRRRILQLQAQLQTAIDEAAIANRQEQITHDVMHDWKGAASGYYMALQWIGLTIPKLLADCHSPESVLQQMRDFIKDATSKTPFPQIAHTQAQAQPTQTILPE